MRGNPSVAPDNAIRFDPPVQGAAEFGGAGAAGALAMFLACGSTPNEPPLAAAASAHSVEASHAAELSVLLGRDPVPFGFRPEAVGGRLRSG